VGDGLRYDQKAGDYDIYTNTPDGNAVGDRYFKSTSALPSPVSVLINTYTGDERGNYNVAMLFYSIGDGWYCTKQGATPPPPAGDSVAVARTLALRLSFTMDSGVIQTGVLRINGEHTLPVDFAAFAFSFSASAGSVSVSIAPKSDYKEFRAYAYSYVNQWKEESGLSMPMPMTVVEGQPVILTIPAATEGAGYCPFSFVRIYRTATGGGGGTDYSFVAEVAMNVREYKDVLRGNELGAPSASADFDCPPQGLRGLTLMSNGILVGFMGRDLYFARTRPSRYLMQL